MLKHTVYILVLLSLSFQIGAQEFAIANRRQHILYVGVPNPVTIAVNKYECKDVKLVLSYGKAAMDDGPCNYNITVNRPGKVMVSLYTKKDNKLIGELEYKAKFIPDPIADRPEPNKKLKREELSLNVDTNRNYYRSIEDTLDFKIEYFTVTILRCGQVLYSKEVKGASCDAEAKEKFDQLQAGDVVWFEDIEAYAPDGKLRKLNSMSFTIVE